MNKLAILEKKVKEHYLAKNPNRDEWCDWLADNHVWVVADYATQVAKKYNANPDLARAAALLHDFADVQMSRFDDNHEAESLRLARELMTESGYSEKEISLVVDDAIRFHSCYDGKTPSSVEGKVLATADSMAHLKTDFYVYAVWTLGKRLSLDETKQWVLKKLDRDLYSKVSFDKIREELRPDYDRLKELFSR